MRVTRYRWLVHALQVVAGAAVTAAVATAVVALARPGARPAPRAGWQVLRPPHDVEALLVDGGNIWAGGSRGLALVERATGRLLPLPDGTPSVGRVTALLEDRTNAIWVAHDAGLSVRRNGRWESVQVERRPLSASGLVEDRAGHIWVGLRDGVVRLPGATSDDVRSFRGDRLADIDVLCEDRRGTIWAGSSSPTRGGLWSFDGASWRRFTVEDDGLPHPSVNMIREDRAGDLWVATGFATRGGAARLHDGQWTTLSVRDGLAGDKVRSVFEDHAGRLWFGSEYDGVAVRGDGRWLYLRESDGLGGREVKVVAEDVDGTYWLGTEQGLTRVSGTAWPLGTERSR
jgi:ligand-binding sensor domain-containing protein